MTEVDKSLTDPFHSSKQNIEVIEEEKNEPEVEQQSFK